MGSARVREASGIVTVVVPHVRTWNLAVQKERLCAERMGTLFANSQAGNEVS